MKKFQVAFYFTLFTLGWGEKFVEDFSVFKFQCIDKACSEPIKEVRARTSYNPDHNLKKRLNKSEEVLIYGVSNDTELLLVNKNIQEACLVPAYVLYYDKRIQKMVTEQAKELVSLKFPSTFAKTTNKQQTKGFLSSSTKKPGRSGSHSDVKLRMFFEAVLYNSMNFFESKNSSNPSVAGQIPRVTHGENLHKMKPPADNSTKDNTVVRNDDVSEVDDDDESSLDAEEKYYEKISGNSLKTDDTMNADRENTSRDLQASENLNSSGVTSTHNDSAERPNITNDEETTGEPSDVDVKPEISISTNANPNNKRKPEEFSTNNDSSATTNIVDPLRTNIDKKSFNLRAHKDYEGESQLFGSESSNVKTGESELNPSSNGNSITSQTITFNESTPLQIMNVKTGEPELNSSSNGTSTSQNSSSNESTSLYANTNHTANFSETILRSDEEISLNKNADSIVDSLAAVLENIDKVAVPPNFDVGTKVPQTTIKDNTRSAVIENINVPQAIPRESVSSKEIQILPDEMEGKIKEESVEANVGPENQDDPENVHTSDTTTLKPELEAVVLISNSISSSDKTAYNQSGIFDTTPIPSSGVHLPTYFSNSDDSLLGAEKSTETAAKIDQPTDEEITDEQRVDEKSFYASAVEYLSTFTVNIATISGWFSQNVTQSEFCEREQDCDGVILHPMEGVNIDIEAQMVQIPFWGEISALERERMSTYAIILLLTVFLVITSTFSMFNREWKKKEKTLVAFVNRLEGKLLVSTREISTLEEQINNVKTRPMDNSLNAEKKEAIKEAFNKQLKQYEDKNSELEDKVMYLEKELESVQNYALEMHKLFENSLTTQSTSRAAIDEVDELRMLTEKQENEIDDLRREMESIIIENQILKEANENTKSMSKKFEQDYNAQMKKNLELSEKQKELTFKLEKETDNNSTLENEYKSQIYQLHSKLEEMEMKLKRSEFQVEEMGRVITQKQDGGGSETTNDGGLLKIHVSTLEAMNLDLANQLKEEKGARRMVEDHLGSIIKELNILKKTFEISEKERNEAVTKLQVLTDYFNHEKNKMHKELETKEKLLTENENKDQLLSRTMQSLKEEINNYKLQNEALKKEINEQEVSYKIQLAKAEQKGRDDWFALRKTERKYKECQQEAASLRNRILILESNMNQKEDEKINAGMNGDLTTPPPPLTYPLISPDMLPLPIPPPLTPPLPSHSVEFEPPMPLLYSSDERLPPLGGRRVPSPPNSNPGDDDEFTPPPPIPGYLSNRNRNEMSSSYMRTAPHSSRQRSSQFKPRRPRNSVDSPSSGVSVESLDKSTR